MATWEIKTEADYTAAYRAIQDKINKATEGAQGATLQAVTDVSLDCLGRAVERAPVETGDLRGSGYVNINGADVAQGNQDGGVNMTGSPAAGDGKTNEAEIGFTAPYAFVQHEHTEFNHPMGGQAKYLESVVVENEEKWAKHLAESARNGLREGV